MNRNEVKKLHMLHKKVLNIYQKSENKSFNSYRAKIQVNQDMKKEKKI